MASLVASEADGSDARPELVTAHKGVAKADGVGPKGAASRAAKKPVRPVGVKSSSKTPSSVLKTPSGIRRARMGAKTPRTIPPPRPPPIQSVSRGNTSSSYVGRRGLEGTPTSIRKYGQESSTPPAQPTPRQAAILAKQQLAQHKQREAAMLKQQQDQLKSAAKAKQAERMAEQQRTLKARADRAQRQRLAAAAARRDEHDRKIEREAMELQRKREEQMEMKEAIARRDKERRRKSVAFKNEAWSKERELKRQQQEMRREEERRLREADMEFREARDIIREEEQQAEQQERMWRERKAFLDRRYDMGKFDLNAYEAYELRRNREADQAALDAAAAEERRQRRTSAQWARNKKLLDREIERGLGHTLDPVKLADDLRWRAESRKEEEEFKETQKALRRQSKMRRRKSEMRKKRVQKAMDEYNKAAEEDLRLWSQEGVEDAAKYEEACIWRERESLDRRREAYLEDQARSAWAEDLKLEIAWEERALSELVREDELLYKKELQEREKMEDKYRRHEQIRERILKNEDELRRREAETQERRILLDDRESVNASKKRAEAAEIARKEELREVPSAKTKLEILETIWAKQTHPAAAAAARNRQRLRLATVKEGKHEPSANAAGIAETSFCSSTRSGSESGTSSSSGMGIKGRISRSGSFDSTSGDSIFAQGQIGINDLRLIAESDAGEEDAEVDKCVTHFRWSANGSPTNESFGDDHGRNSSVSRSRGEEKAALFGNGNGNGKIMNLTWDDLSAISNNDHRDTNSSAGDDLFVAPPSTAGDEASLVSKRDLGLTIVDPSSLDSSKGREDSYADAVLVEGMWGSTVITDETLSIGASQEGTESDPGSIDVTGEGKKWSNQAEAAPRSSDGSLEEAMEKLVIAPLENNQRGFPEVGGTSSVSPVVLPSGRKKNEGDSPAEAIEASPLTERNVLDQT